MWLSVIDNNSVIEFEWEIEQEILKGQTDEKLNFPFQAFQDKNPIS